MKIKRLFISNFDSMKKFIWKTLLYSFPIILPIVFYAMCISPHIHGDLGKLGQYTFSDDYIVETSKKIGYVHNIHYKDTALDGILVIGDSFSQPSGHSYTSYLASWSTKNIYNLHADWYISPFNRCLFLANQKLIPKIVILESVERHLPERLLSAKFAFSPQEMICKSIIDTTHYETKHRVKKSSETSLLLETSMWVKRRIDYFGYANPVRKTTLHTSMFTCEGEETSLYFYQDDLHYSHSKDTLSLMAAKMDSLFAFANANDIHIYVLIAEDKYDLYQTYIADTAHWEKTLLEDFCPLVQTPYLINSKDTLSKMAAAGVKDIYYCNDTHWSPIGAEAVAMQVAQRIMELEGDSTLFHLPR